MAGHVQQSELFSRHSADPAWPWVALLLSIALFGLVHDLDYATAWGTDSAEAGRYFDRQAEFQANIASASTGRKIGFGCLVLVGMYCGITVPKSNRLQWSLLTLAIGSGLMWTLASAMRSIEPEQSMRELMRLCAYLFVAAMLALRFDPRSLCLLLTTTLIVSVAASLSFEVLTGGFRPWIADYRLSGTLHSAAVGCYSMLLTLAAYAIASRRSSKVWWGVFVFAATTLVFSKALTSLVAAAGGMVAIHLVDKSRQKLIFGAWCATVFLAMGLLAASAMDVWDEVGSGRIDTLGRDYDFTSFNGRIPLWNILCEKLAGRWIEGFGYGGFWISKNVELLHDELNWYANHAHSAYLGTVVHLGIAGLVLLLTIALLTFRCTTQRLHQHGAPEFYVFAAWLTAAFIIGIAETSFVEPRDMGLWTAAIVFSCIVKYESAYADARQSVAAARLAENRPPAQTKGFFA